MGLIVNIIHRKYYKAVTVFKGLETYNSIREFVSIGLMMVYIGTEIFSYVWEGELIPLPMNLC
jgi:hypothetical protein